MIDEKRAFRDWPASCATQFIEDFEGRRLVAYRCCRRRVRRREGREDLA